MSIITNAITVPELQKQIDGWCDNVDTQAGDFLKTFVQCYRHADASNKNILFDVLLQFMVKYPEYLIHNFKKAQKFEKFNALKGR